MPHFRHIVPILATLAGLVIRVSSQQGIPIDYCADINTADGPANSSIYQSEGLCRDFCRKRGSSFAIVHSADCWCSNFIPTDDSQSDVNSCNVACPGFPSDVCGADGLWGYIQLSAPSGTSSNNNTDLSTTVGSETTSRSTVSSSVSSSTVTSTTSSTVESTTSIPVSTSSSTPPGQSEPTSSTSSSPSSTSSSSSSSSSSSDDSSPTTPPALTITKPTQTVSTVTSNGRTSVITVTFTPTPGSSGSDTTIPHSSHHGLGTGPAVGLAIGILAVVGIIIGLVVFFCMRRKKQEKQEEMASNPASHRGSSAGMMGTPTTGIASVWDGDVASTGRRSSRLMPHDPRMDPYATNMYARFENKSRESVNTLQDNQDYSRKVLRTTNPDPVD